MFLCFIDPRVRKIRNEASSCPGIFSRTLRFYYVTTSTGSPLPHLLDGHTKLVGCSAIPAMSCPGPVRYNHYTHPADPFQDKKTNVFDTSMASPFRQHNFTVRVSHRCIITAAECGRSRHRPSLGAPAMEYPGLYSYGF